ncbi:hypothetical protein KCU93_g374, partial [Aureobasidium melanogenum]
MISSILSMARIVYSGELVLFWGIAIYLPFRLLWDHWNIVQIALRALWRFIKNLFRCSKPFWTLLMLVASMISGIVWWTPGKTIPTELASPQYLNASVQATETMTNAVFAPICPTQRYLHQSYEHELRALYELDLMISPINFQPLSIVANDFDLTSRQLIASKDKVREDYEDVREREVPQWIKAHIQETNNPRVTDMVEDRLDRLRLSLQRCMGAYTTLLGKGNGGIASHLVYEMESLQYHIHMRQQNGIRHYNSQKPSSEREAKIILFVKRSATASLETIDSRLRSAFVIVKILRKSLSEHSCFEGPVTILNEDWAQATREKAEGAKGALQEIKKASSNWRPLSLGPKNM